MVERPTLAQALEQADNVVDFLRDQDWPPITFPITPEFTNWRDEQRAWRTGVALMDQSTQQNAALVEEIAAASDSLKSQGHELDSTVRFFKL